MVTTETKPSTGSAPTAGALLQVVAAAEALLDDGSLPPFDVLDEGDGGDKAVYVWNKRQDEVTGEETADEDRCTDEHEVRVAMDIREVCSAVSGTGVRGAQMMHRPEGWYVELITYRATARYRQVVAAGTSPVRRLGVDGLGRWLEDDARKVPLRLWGGQGCTLADDEAAAVVWEWLRSGALAPRWATIGQANDPAGTCRSWLSAAGSGRGTLCHGPSEVTAFLRDQAVDGAGVSGQRRYAEVRQVGQGWALLLGTAGSNLVRQVAADGSSTVVSTQPRWELPRHNPAPVSPGQPVPVPSELAGRRTEQAGLRVLVTEPGWVWQRPEQCASLMWAYVCRGEVPGEARCSR